MAHPYTDIKPYISYADSHPDAANGFIETINNQPLTVDFPDELWHLVPEDKRTPLNEILSHDPRPSYQDDAERVYGVSFAGMDIRFTVDGQKLTVNEVIK